MMGLSDGTYWFAVFVSDGVCVGALCALILTIIGAPARLFNNFGEDAPDDARVEDGFMLFFFLWFYVMATVAFTFVPAAIFSTAVASSVFSLVWQVGATVIHHVNKPFKRSLSMQLWAALVPQLAFHLGVESWIDSPTSVCDYVVYKADDPTTRWTAHFLRKGKKNACDDCSRSARLPSKQGNNSLAHFILTNSDPADDGGEGYAFGGVAYENSNTREFELRSRVFEFSCAQSTIDNPQYTKTDVGDMIGMFVLDAFICFVLAWYLQQVFPNSVGVRKPPYFVFLPSYWKREKPAARAGGGTGGGEMALPLNAGEEADYAPVEPVDPALLGAEPSVTVRNLRKTFGAFTAVAGISFDMWEDQIFALLGHNGAGKTTTQHILTGMFEPDAPRPDSRDGVTVYGHSIADGMDALRATLGVCPQHDTLFPRLTTREHLLFFAQLKGREQGHAEAEADVLLRTFALEHRADHLGHELSGGMRRKLSTAVALCGGSRFVTLDEPTAGMDPVARRELWTLLKGVRRGKTLLLTTHYMDEADVLGDRIAIMAQGKLKCTGSSAFLKRTFGTGYTVSLHFRGALGGGVAPPAAASGNGFAPEEQGLSLIHI